jgi:hypothetical protein
MSIIQIMVTIIIVTILVTVILGVASYGAYWLRRGRRPAEPLEVDTSPRFFYRFVPNGDRELEAVGARGGALRIDSPVPLAERGTVEYAAGGTGR